MPKKTITSNDGEQTSASAVLEVFATNPAFNQPALHIKHAADGGKAASIRIDDPNPDIEFVESDQASPAGKYEIAVQTDQFQINGRHAAEQRFETIAIFTRVEVGGNFGLHTRNSDGTGFHKNQFGDGSGVIGIGNATAAPVKNPEGGGILYVENGALMYRGSNGTVTMLAPA